MEITKTRREYFTSSSGGTVNMPQNLLKTVVTDIVTGKSINCSGVMTFTRQTALPTTEVSYSHTIPGQPTGSSGSTIVTFYPSLITASSCGMDVYIWYGDRDTVYYYTDATNIIGLNSIQLDVPNISYTGNYLFIPTGNGNWRMYITSSGTFTTTEQLAPDYWLLGGGGAGAGNAAGDGTSSTKWFGRGGGGGGYRYTFLASNHTEYYLKANYEYAFTVGSGGTATNTNVTGDGGTATRVQVTQNTSSGEILSELLGLGGLGGQAPKASASLVAGAGGDGGSGGGGGGAKAKDGGSGGTNGGDGKTGGSGSTDDLGRTLSGGSGGDGSGTSGYAFGDSSFDGIRRGDGGDGGGGMNSTHTLVTGGANTGTGGDGANGYANTNTTAYMGRSGGSGLIILRNAS